VIEIMGHQEFVKFNGLVVSLAGPKAMSRSQKLIEIGRSARMSITYGKVSRPLLKETKEA